MRLGSRQKWYLMQAAIHEVGGLAFFTPWGPIENERLRLSLVRRGLLVRTLHPGLWGTFAHYELTPEGRVCGRAEAEAVQVREGWHKRGLPW